MQLHIVDWIIVGSYAAFALTMGLVYARRAGRDVNQYFLTGRSLPWWIAGTSMVATTFAADTPLVISGWVRDYGIWKNWLWWCLCIGGMATVFLFSRYWRRGEVMTTAELAELRYGDRGAGLLRGFLGFYHAGLTNTLTLCWVILAGGKIMDVLFDIPEWAAIGAACTIAVTYALMAGLWGVVMTDLLQFATAMVGSIALAFFAIDGVGGLDGLLEKGAAGAFSSETLSFIPSTGDGGVFDGSFWTVPIAAFAVYLGVSWWAVDSVDGGGLVVQRVSAARDERHGILAALWYNLAHYALRPWPWILVALASLVILPSVSVVAPATGVVQRIEENAIVIEAESGAPHVEVSLAHPDLAEDWELQLKVKAGDQVEKGRVIAATDSERAYVVMMQRFLPVGLLGLVVASLLAAFMSTIDTHVNLAASYFVNDVYRRFLVRNAQPRHYVGVARWASVGIILLGGLFALLADSISDLYLFFLAFLGGVGPVYILRWLWWRIRASTEIAAMLASSVAAVLLTIFDTGWSLGSLSPGGSLAPEGRLCIVVVFSAGCAFLSLLFTKTPEPSTLVPFYRRIRPLGCWGPVRTLCPDVEPPRNGRIVVLGFVGGIAMVYGILLGLGFLLLGSVSSGALALVVATAGAVAVKRALDALRVR